MKRDDMMREFKIRLSDEDMIALRGNCYMVEQEPNKQHTDTEILKFELSSIMELDGRFGELLYLPSLEVEEDRQ